MKITILYKLMNSISSSELNLSEKEYFDPIEDRENYEDDAIPKFNDNREYISKYNKQDFEWSLLIISESSKNNKKIKTEYFSNGESQIIHRKDENGFELIIQDIMIRDNEVYISRMERENPNTVWKTNCNLGVNPKEKQGEEKWIDLKYLQS